MNTLSIFTILSFFLALMASLAQAATQVIVPLYAYATDPEWSTVESSLAQYPGIDFIIIINPSNGPESSSLNSDWSTAIAKLKSYANCQVIGYSLTNFGERAISDVESDINMYAAWPSSYAVDGIFLDEVSTNDVSYYNTLASYVKSKISPGIVVLNPGALTATEYFDFATVVIFEDTYETYTSQSVPGPPAGAAGASSIIINTMPDSESDFSSLISEFISGGYGSVYLTDDPATYQTLGNYWGTFCDLMSSAVGSSGTTSTPAASTPYNPPAAPSSSSSTSANTPSTSEDTTPEYYVAPPESDNTDSSPTTTTSTDPTPADTTDGTEVVTTTTSDPTPTDPEEDVVIETETSDDNGDWEDDNSDDSDDDDDSDPSPSPSWLPHSRPHHHHHGWWNKHRQWA